MEKRKRIFWIIVATVVVAVIVLLKVFPLWVSLTGVVCLGVGCVIGWWGKIFYDRYIKG